MFSHSLRAVPAFATVVCVAGSGSTLYAQASAVEDALVKRARVIHEKVITLDTHIDFSPANLVGERNYTQRLETQFNLPKMIDGGLDALFFSIFVGQTREAQNPDAFKPVGYERAYKAAIEKFDAVHRFTCDIAPDKMELALTSAEVHRINAQGADERQWWVSPLCSPRFSLPRSQILHADASASLLASGSISP